MKNLLKNHEKLFFWFFLNKLLIVKLIAKIKIRKFVIMWSYYTLLNTKKLISSNLTNNKPIKDAELKRKISFLSSFFFFKLNYLFVFIFIFGFFKLLSIFKRCFSIAKFFVRLLDIIKLIRKDLLINTT